MILKSTAAANLVLVELASKNLIHDETASGHSWIKINYGKIGFDAETYDRLSARLPRFTEIGPPHSNAGMSTLAELFRSDSEIYVILSVTSHDAFPAISERSEQGRKTVFMFPSPRYVSGKLREHYTEVLNEWIRFLKSGPAQLRRNTKLIIGTVDFSDIYTCALAVDEARINVNDVKAPSTRDGTLLRVDSSSTLYRLFRERVDIVYKSTRPLLRLDLQAYLIHLVQLAVWPAFLAMLAIAFAYFKHPIAGLVSAVAAGLLRAWISEALGVTKWAKNELFPK
jgi:hypothetical protein